MLDWILNASLHSCQSLDYLLKPVFGYSSVPRGGVVLFLDFSSNPVANKENFSENIGNIIEL